MVGGWGVWIPFPDLRVLGAFRAVLLLFFDRDLGGRPVIQAQFVTDFSSRIHCCLLLCWLHCCCCWVRDSLSGGSAACLEIVGARWDVEFLRMNFTVGGMGDPERGRLLIRSFWGRYVMLDLVRLDNWIWICALCSRAEKFIFLCPKKALPLATSSDRFLQLCSTSLAS